MGPSLAVVGQSIKLNQFPAFAWFELAKMQISAVLKDGGVLQLFQLLSDAFRLLLLLGEYLTELFRVFLQRDRSRDGLFRLLSPLE